MIRKLFALAGTRTGVMALTTFGNLVIRTLSSMALTRLLKPDDFGVVGIIGSVFYTVAMITDLGFTAFLMRHERTGEKHFRDVIWTIHATRGFALFGLVAFASPFIAWLFAKPTVALPLAVAGVTIAINGVASMSMITALRDDKARQLSFIDLGLQGFQTVCCILLALWWRNAWALIAAMVLQSIARTISSYWFFRNSRQRPARDAEITREFLRFSRLILISSGLTLLLAQTDKFVLGRMFTLREFGLYALALSITSAPIAFAESYVARVAFPVYAEAWREWPDQLGNVYYRVRRWATRLYSFMCGGLIGGAPLLVALLYDPRYGAAATFISLIMVSGSLRLSNVAAMELLTAAGQMKGLIHINVVRILWLALGIPTGFFAIGGLGVVAAVGLIEVPAMIYCWLLLRRIHVLDLRQEVSFLASVAAGVGTGYSIAVTALEIFPHL